MSPPWGRADPFCPQLWVLRWVTSNRSLSKGQDRAKRGVLFSRSVVSDSFATPWTAACRVPLSMGLPRQEYWSPAAAAAKSRQSCPTLCGPIDGSPPGSRVPGILQARTLEWVAISFSNSWKWKVNVKSLSCVRLLATPWTAAYQAPLFMGFSRQEYWSGLLLPSPQSSHL